MHQSKGYFLFSLRIWSVVSSSWVTNGWWWLLTLASYLLLDLYVIFDCRYLEVAVDCFVGNIPGCIY